MNGSSARLNVVLGGPPTQAGQPVSSWLAEAAASKLRAQALADFLASWESEHDVLTPEEITRAERELGLAAGDTAA